MPEHDDVLRERALELLRELRPTEDAHVFVNGPYETYPAWSVGWVDKLDDPDKCFTRTAEKLHFLVRLLKKELKKKEQTAE